MSHNVLSASFSGATYSTLSVSSGFGRARRFNLPFEVIGNSVKYINADGIIYPGKVSFK